MNFFEKFRLETSKKRCNIAAVSTLSYMMIMNVAVLGSILINTIILVIVNSVDAQLVPWASFEGISESGMGYFVAIIISIALLLIWKKPAYIRETVMRSGKPMGIMTFFMLLAIFIAPQLMFGIYSSVIESVLNGFGYTYQSGIDSATGVTYDFIMFLYIGLGAPVMEELLFRGVVLRTLEPMGKKFAIVCSALLFGLFHGNMLQIPYAFVVGLLLAYVALEYNVFWAMVLHMFNNLILGDTISRFIGGDLGSLAVSLLIIGCFIIGIICLALNFGKICKYFIENKNQPMAYRSFFTAPCVIIFLVYSVISAVYVFISSVHPI